MTKRSLPLVPTEEQEQIILSTWMTKKGIRHYAVPNGGRRSFSEGVKFKRSGVSPGVPDIVVPYPRSSYHGLYIELKRKEGGVVSQYQADWLTFLRGQGYRADIARGFDEAKAIVEQYLRIS